MARRLHAMGAPGYENEFKLTLHENRLEQPLLRKKPTTYFVNSMSDLFHECLHPGETLVQPVVGFHVCSVHSIVDCVAIRPPMSLRRCARRAGLRVFGREGVHQAG